LIKTYFHRRSAIPLLDGRNEKNNFLPKKSVRPAGAKYGRPAGEKKVAKKKEARPRNWPPKKWLPGKLPI
jgi:hypothetical protein